MIRIFIGGIKGRLEGCEEKQKVVDYLVIGKDYMGKWEENWKKGMR